MRPHRRRRSAALIALAFAATGIGLTPSPVAAADCPAPLTTCIVVSVVKTADGQTTILKQYTVAPDDLKAMAEAGLKDRGYALRKNSKSKGGEIDDRPIAQGDRVSLNKLFTSLDPTQDLINTSTYLETPNPAGIPSVLAPADLADPSSASPPAEGAAPAPYPFAANLPPMVFLTSGGRIGFIRPLRDVDEDTNAADYFQTTGRLDLTVHTTGGLLAPTVTSSNGTALDIDATTDFSVTYADTPRARVKSILWDFGDGSTKGTKREKPSKTFAKRGTFPVVVTVRTDDGSYGRSAPLEIKVAKPPKAPSSGSGGGSGLGGGGGSTGPSLPPPSSFDSFEPPSEIDDPPVEEDLPETEPVPVDDGLEPVEGYVLAGAEIVPGGTPETIPGTENTSTPAPATQASMRQRVATWVVAALAVALLLGMGAASETRWFRHRLRHLRRRE